MKLVWLIVILVLIGAIILVRARIAARRRRQIEFIRTQLANSRSEEPGLRVIASLSTLPDRIANLEPTLRCLLEQTRPPDEIVLWIPEFSRRQQKRYVAPEYLKSFERLRIMRCDTDWGPATKYIPIVQEELAAGRSRTCIVIVDDDRVYPADAIETYLHYHSQLPDAVIAFRGAPMPASFTWHPKIVRGDRIRQPRKVAVVTGCGSYLIQPRFFDETFWDYSSAPPGAFYMDDIWLSGCLDRKGVEKYVVPTSTMMRTVPEQAGTMTLRDVPQNRRYNNNEVIAFFRESWNVF